MGQLFSLLPGFSRRDGGSRQESRRPHQEGLPSCLRWRWPWRTDVSHRKFRKEDPLSARPISTGTWEYRAAALAGGTDILKRTRVFPLRVGGHGWANRPSAPVFNSLPGGGVQHGRNSQIHA